jgi:predicted nucleic acid-binding protein
VLVVSDTSPLRALQSLELVHLLLHLHGSVVIPPAVQAELAVSKPLIPAFSIDRYAFIQVRRPATVRSFPTLGRGESEALSLALELHAHEVLIDDLNGRRAAERIGLKPIGALAVLAAAKHKGLVPAVGPLIAQLERNIGFRISQRVKAEVLKQTGEL